jgi:two-component system chemotaxis response regulator CheB
LHPGSGHAEHGGARGGRSFDAGLIVLGGSAGALEPLISIVAALPEDLPAAVLVALHVYRGAPSMLPKVLDRAGPLPARHPRPGEPLQPASIFVAPPDRHLIVRENAVELSRGPRENRHRPAVDALFNSAARWHGPAVVAVVLSGALDDGSAGAAGVAAQDGLVIVQDPAEAQVTGMPRAALAAVRGARTVHSREIAPLLSELVSQPRSPTAEPVGALLRWESKNMTSSPTTHRGQPPGSPTALSCPDCQGGMFETTTGGGLHYLCHVGHSWSPETLLDAQREASEAALYNAAAKLVEEASVLERIAEYVTANEETPTVDLEDLHRRADHARRRAVHIQEIAREE